MPYDFHLAPEDIVADVCTGLLRNRAASQSHLRHLRIGVNWWRRSRDCCRRLCGRPVCTAAWARRGRPAWARRGTRGRSPASPRAPARWSTAAAAQPCTAAWISPWLRLLRWRCVLIDWCWPGGGDTLLSRHGAALLLGHGRANPDTEEVWCEMLLNSSV